MGSARWKDLERYAATQLHGERVTEHWTLFRKRPDVLVPLPDDRRLVVDCKAHARHSIMRHVDKVQREYCTTGADIPCVVIREPRGEAMATVPLVFLAGLIQRLRQRTLEEKHHD